MKIQFSEKCAWRATYLKTATGFQFFHFGVDPHDGVKPKFFGALTIRKPGWKPGDRAIVHWHWRIALPWVAWGSTYRKPRWLWLPLYQVVRRFWHNVDGRY